MKKTIKIITILMLVITIVSFANSVFALDPSAITPSTVSTGDLQDKAAKVAGLLRNIAVIASVLIVMVLGIKYMLGSVEEKAEYKKSFMPLIIGIIVVVSATQIATFIFNIGS